jgi:phage-related protein
MAVSEMNEEIDGAKSYLFLSRKNDELYLMDESKRTSLINVKSGINLAKKHQIEPNVWGVFSDIHSDEIFEVQLCEIQKVIRGGFTRMFSRELCVNHYLDKREKQISVNSTLGMIKYGASDCVLCNHNRVFTINDDFYFEMGALKNSVEFENSNILLASDRKHVKYANLSTGVVKMSKDKLLQQRINCIHKFNMKLFFVDTWK